MGEVVKELKTKLTLKYPCVVSFEDDYANQGVSIKLTLLPEPVLTDVREFTFSSSHFLADPMEARADISGRYFEFIQKQIDYDAMPDPEDEAQDEVVE